MHSVLFRGGTPWFPLPAHAQGSKQARQGHPQLPGRQMSHCTALAQPLPHPWLHADVPGSWLGSQLLVLCPQCHSLRSGKMHKGTFLRLFLTHPRCPVWNKHRFWKREDASDVVLFATPSLILTQPFSSPSVYKVLKVLKFCQNLHADFNLACTIKTLIAGKWFSSREPQITAESLRYW